MLLALRRLPAAPAALAFAAAVLGAVGARARGVEVDRAPRTVPSLFFVAKSENRNQVHYGLHLDDSCAPVGASPVFAYWRMFERGPLATEPLLALEVRAYGLASQRPQEGREGAPGIVVTLNALPTRQIAIESKSDGRACSAKARTSIDGVPAVLANVFVQLR